MSHEGYDHPLPPIPDSRGVKPSVRHILNLYAVEIREHASVATVILGLETFYAERYKNILYQAAYLLDEAVELLKTSRSTAHLFKETNEGIA
jgi:hypothetical protein